MKLHGVWVVVCISIGALSYFLFAAVRPPQVVERVIERVVEKPVETIKEVPVDRVVTETVAVPVEKVVEKIVEVPAEIPEAYKLGHWFMTRWSEAKATDEKFTLKDIPSVRVFVFIDPAIADKIGSNEIKTQIELTLRTSGVKVSDDAHHFVNFKVTGMWEADNKVLFTFNGRLYVDEFARLIRGGEVIQTLASSWSHEYSAIAGVSKIRESVASVASSLTSAFANDFLAANGK